MISATGSCFREYKPTHSLSEKRDGLSVCSQSISDTLIVRGYSHSTHALLPFELFDEFGILSSFSLIVASPELVGVVHG